MNRHEVPETGRAAWVSTIFTDAEGRPLDKPQRVDFATDLTFVQAMHAWFDMRAKLRRDAFDAAFRRAMRPARSRKWAK